MRKTPRGWIQIGESRTRGVARIPLGLKPSRDSRGTSQRDSPIWIQPLGVFRYKRRCFPTCMQMTLSCALLINHMSILDRAFAWPVQHLLAPLLRTSAILWIGKYQQVHCKNHFRVTSSNWSIYRVTGPLCGEFPSQRPVKRSFGVFFDLCLNKRLDKHSRR